MLKVFSTLKQQTTRIMLASAALLASATSYGQWMPLGDPSGISGGGVQDVHILATGGKLNDVVYVAYKDLNASPVGITIQKWSAGSWTTLGAPGILSNGRDPKLAIKSGSLYVAYQSGAAGDLNKEFVKIWDGTTWTAPDPNPSGANTTGTAFASAGGVLWLCYSDGGNKMIGTKNIGGSYSPQSTPITAGASTYNSIAMFDANTPLVLSIDAGSSSLPTPKYFNGASWTNLGSALTTGSGYYTQIATGNGYTYAVVSDLGSGKLDRAFYFTASTVTDLASVSWSNAIDTGFTEDEADYNSLIVDTVGVGHKPVVAFCRNTGSGGKANVMTYNSGGPTPGWAYIGGKDFSAGNASYTSLSENNYGDYFVAYSDASHGGKLVVQVFRNPLSVGNVTTVNNSLEVYPNPNTGSFTVKGSVKGSYSVSNMLGQTIRTIELNASNGNRVTVSGLNSGVYFIHGADGMNQKVVVTK